MIKEGIAQKDMAVITSADKTAFFSMHWIMDILRMKHPETSINLKSTSNDNLFVSMIKFEALDLLRKGSRNIFNKDEFKLTR